MRESKLQKVQVCGEWEEWVVCEWVSTCVLDLDLGLDLACKMLARLACLGGNKGGGGGPPAPRSKCDGNAYAMNQGGWDGSRAHVHAESPGV